MQEIGRILLLQVQRSTLKLEQGSHSYYDPAPLLGVASLRLTPQGVFGITEDGSEIMDLHHAQHPTSHNIRGVNGVSVGFSSHYQTMREAYGHHLVNGSAGENILVAADTVLQLKDLGERLAIHLQKTGQFVYLTNLKVAAPCIEFSHFAAGDGIIGPRTLPPAKLKATLQFLHQGRRGFYATVADQPAALIVHVGDKVFVADGA